MGGIQDPLGLVREASRQSKKLEPYNEELIRKTTKEINDSYDDAKAWSFQLNSSNSLFENSNEARVVAIQNLIQRNIRILNVYHLTRLKCIADISTSVSILPENLKTYMIPAETSFLDDYLNCILDYSQFIGRSVNIKRAQFPPRELYIQIRVNKDCGLIQTEWGKLHLDVNTMHFVRRVDVQNLIDQGFVTHIK
jgi:GINS complex subunit 1